MKIRGFVVAITTIVCILMIWPTVSPQMATAQVGTNGMAYAQVNKSGCVVFKGNCQIRLDFYLEPDDVRYYDRYLYVVNTTSVEYLAGYPGAVDAKGNPIDQTEYDKWWELLPRIWANTPFHSHFIYLPATFTEDDIKAAIGLHIGNFYKAFEDGWDAIAGGMRHGWATETRIEPTDYSKVENANDYGKRVLACQTAIDSLVSFNYSPEKGGLGQTYPATAIDIGPEAIDRPTGLANGFTFIDITNPANDTGHIDTFEIWASASMTGTNKVGTFYGSGTSYTNRDGATIGTVTSGAKRTFTGLTIDVSTSDLAGVYYSVGLIEATGSGASNVYYKSGNQFGTGTQTYISAGPNTISLYGTGETAGCSPSISLNQTSWSVNSGSPVTAGSNYNTGITWCTITNNSGGAVSITIGGTDMTGGNAWDLSDDGSAGNMIYGLYSGLDDADDTYDVVVKEAGPYNTLVASLADTGTQDFGLKIYVPTTFTDGVAKSGTVTLTATCL